MCEVAAHLTDHVLWSYDFVLDRTEDGRLLKFMPVLDEYTRESLALEVERSMTGEDVVDTLAYLFQVHGEPEFIHSDNGPEFVSKAVKEGDPRALQSRFDGVRGCCSSRSADRAAS